MNEKAQLIDKLKNSFSSRVAYTKATTSVNVASQIKALRRRRKMTQEELGKLMGTGQPRVSAIERPGELLTVDTLVRLASAFRVGLMIQFVPFSEMLNWENSYRQDSFDATPIEKDTEFLEPKSIERTHFSPTIDESLARNTWFVALPLKLEASHLIPVEWISPRIRTTKAQVFELAERVSSPLGSRSSVGQVGGTISSPIH